MARPSDARGPDTNVGAEVTDPVAKRDGLNNDRSWRRHRGDKLGDVVKDSGESSRDRIDGLWYGEKPLMLILMRQSVKPSGSLIKILDSKS